MADGVTVNYGGGGSGKGKTDLAGKMVDFAGTDSLIKPRRSRPTRAAPILYFPTVAAPITVSYNLRGVDELKLSADDARRDLSSTDHDVERPGHRRRQPRRHPAEHGDHGRAPLRRLGHHQQLHQVPDAGRRADGLDPGHRRHRQLGRRARRPATATRRGPDHPSHRRRRRLRRLLRRRRLEARRCASIKNKAGKFVAPTLDGASAAVGLAPRSTPDLTYDPLNATGADAYPITAATYVHRVPEADGRDDGQGPPGLAQLHPDRRPGPGHAKRTSPRCPPTCTRRPWPSSTRCRSAEVGRSHERVTA